MMFIRCASHVGEQNLVAYQYGTDIYYSTTKPIAAKEELKVTALTQYVILLIFIMVAQMLDMIITVIVLGTNIYIQ